MRIMKVGNPTFNGLKINANENKEVKYLYNEVLDIVKINKVPATFSTDYIELPTVTDKIIKALTELKIKFIQGEK